MSLRRFVPVTTTLIVAALISPVGAATWSAFGGYEPDTSFDDATLMFQGPPGPGESKIYFAAFSTTGGVANVNAAAIGSRMEQVTLEYHEAILGIWVDCNGDDYVGMAESGLYEYATELLLDDSVCPEVTGLQNEWTQGAHNYNGWVTEFVPIGGIDGDEGDDQNNLRVYRDAEAMVWGDYGRPTDGAAAGGTCALTPQPRGTYASTGGMINFVGCPTGVMARWNEIILGRDIMGQPFDGVDPNNDNGLAFQQTPGGLDARGHPIFDQQTLGSEDSSGAAVTIVDCSADPLVHSGDTYNQTGRPLDAVWPILTPDGSGTESFENMTVPSIAPAPTNTPNPGAAGQVNQTNEELLDDCDTSNDRGADTYGTLEGDFNGVSTTRKTESDWNLQFGDTARGSPWGLVLGANGNSGTSSYFGVSPVQNTAGVGLNIWFSDSQLVKRGPRTAAVNTYTGTVDIAPAYYLSFYAHVGAASTAKGQLPGGSGVYGTQCEGADSGIVNGWECDPDQWYINPDGSAIPETYPFARPGQAYELRDVDCYDGSTSQGVPLGAPALGPQPC